MKDIRVKICGITNLEDAQAAIKFGADAIGFIFVEQSPRVVSLDQAKEILSNLNSSIIKVGVFAGQSKEKVLAQSLELGLDYIQLHGQEKPSYCQYFKDKLKVIKVLFPQDRPFKDKIDQYSVEAFLFDILLKDKTEGKRCLSQDILNEIEALVKSGVKVIISGGLNLENLTIIKRINPYGIDVCSSLETYPGKKDHQLLKVFIEKAKKKL